MKHAREIPEWSGSASARAWNSRQGLPRSIRAIPTPNPPVAKLERLCDGGVLSLRHRLPQAPTNQGCNVMKTIVAIIAGLSFGIAGITPASAWHLTPENTSFTGKGSTSATKNGITLKCTANFTGNVDGSGVGYVTGGTFSGALGCSAVTLQNTPWTSTAVSATKVNIANVTFSSPIGNCGPGTVPTTLKLGVIRFKSVSLAGGCVVSGTVTTSPKLSIASGR
jgi:hypothetical protein